MPAPRFPTGYVFERSFGTSSRRRPALAPSFSLELSDIIGSAADRHADTLPPVR